MAARFGFVDNGILRDFHGQLPERSSDCLKNLENMEKILWFLTKICYTFHKF